MFAETFSLISSIIVSIIIAVLVSILFFELLLRLIKFIKYSIFYENISRFDYLDPEYHSYIKWTDNWDKPMFYYFP